MQTKESIIVADVIREITDARATWHVKKMTEYSLNISVSNAYDQALYYLDKLKQRIESLRVPYNPREGLVGAYIRGINTTCNKILGRKEKK